MKDNFPAIKTAFVTPSSSASNRNGTVIYDVVAAVFIAQIHHIDWDLGTLIMIALTSAVPSTGGTGTPATGAVAVFFILTVVNVPANEACLLVHYLLERCNAVINVLGDCIVGVALSDVRVEEELGQEMQSRSSFHVSQSGGRADEPGPPRAEQQEEEEEQEEEDVL
ncbi:neutral amino acid transporter A-like [Pseudoliparis swirei]|uniref:neutral amino acid transporter A-like n=1 Tax=Pseudoliparis swirei TaxID=2059687 RepID=UPI0024BD9AD7|nr:neutral amino acid transporter A-like [Pseudoliparis swirei]